MRTVKECMNLYKENEFWIFDSGNYPYDGVVPEDDMMEKFYSEYTNFGGKHSLMKFKGNLTTFLRITFEAMVTGDMKKHKNLPSGSFWNTRQETYECWVGYLKNFTEANRYWEAINKVAPYT